MDRGFINIRKDPIRREQNMRPIDADQLADEFNDQYFIENRISKEELQEKMRRMWDEHKDEIWELAPEDTAYENVWVCSNCGEEFIQHRKPKFKFCPNCGAKMDEQNGSR